MKYSKQTSMHMHDSVLIFSSNLLGFKCEKTFSLMHSPNIDVKIEELQTGHALQH